MYTLQSKHRPCSKAPTFPQYKERYTTIKKRVEDEEKKEEENIKESVRES
jgi:hypothetical protein